MFPKKPEKNFVIIHKNNFEKKYKIKSDLVEDSRSSNFRCNDAKPNFYYELLNSEKYTSDREKRRKKIASNFQIL